MAPLLAIPVFFILNFVFLHGLNGNFVGIEFISLLFGTILPVVSTIIAVELKKRNNENTEYDLPHKEDRVIPYMLAIISYLTGTIVLYFFNAPLLTIGLMFCYFSNTLIAFLINFCYKISAHSMGVTGPTTALVFAFGYIGFIYTLILPFVMWSRIYLKKHTVLQVITGALLGFVLTAVQLRILFTV
ncbi:Phosphoesterase PA-phosphatase related protein [groundwater metagenome]|uniref:Phosphoesterase PA-phosphatase related protein n=1 Tax=groundwater metagenome TaxID=717931 RepID=A0A098EDB9_9ZZZZ